MRLYEVNAALEALLEQVDPETGELVCDLDALEELNLARDEKLENIALYIKDLTAEAKAIRDEELALAARRKPLENKAARLKDYLTEQLQGEKFQTPRVAVSWRTSRAVNLQPEFMEWAKEHDRFLRYSDPEPDKKAITDALKAGETVPGAELVTNVSMQIK